MRLSWVGFAVTACVITGASLAVYESDAATPDITVAQAGPGGRFGGPGGGGPGGGPGGGGAGGPGGPRGPGGGGPESGGPQTGGQGPREGARGEVRPIPPRDAISLDALNAASMSAVPFIDVHTHMRPTAGKQGATLSAVGGQQDFEGSVANAASQMRQYTAAALIVIPPPNVEGRGFDVAAYAWAFAGHPGLIGGGGGGTLNGMIERAAGSGEMGPQIAGPFRQTAERLAHSGIAVFGEFASEHFSLFAGHPYEESPPDHPLFLMLADVAAENDLPIDLHMEAIPQDMDMPGGFATTNSANPQRVKGNIAALERLLAHNSEARIVWAHAGWDNSGYWTVDLSRRLLAAHPNLFMSIKLDRSALEQSRPVDGSRRIKPEWIALLREFPDRFVIGSDAFFNAENNLRHSEGDGSLSDARDFVDALPDDLRRPIAYANAIRIYRLDKSSGPR